MQPNRERAVRFLIGLTCAAAALVAAFRRTGATFPACHEDFRLKQ